MHAWRPCSFLELISAGTVLNFRDQSLHETESREQRILKFNFKLTNMVFLLLAKYLHCEWQP